jgi:putative methionine-R-sulfoxide reductase with GAF domain
MSNAINVVSSLVDLLQKHFKCRAAEFWSCSPTGGIAKFEIASASFVQTAEAPNVIRHIIKKFEASDVSADVPCAQYFDATEGEPVYVHPFNSGRRLVCLVLIGRDLTFRDELSLTSFLPLIAKCIGSLDDSSEFDAAMAARLQALLNIAEILGGVLEIDTLIPIIMEHACALLNTERCSLFLVDSNRRQLITRFHGGLDHAIKMPMGSGLVGHTAQTGEVLNIPDAYKDPRFDNRIDRETGYHTKAILCVPIFNNRGEIAGVTEMINKKDGKSFNDDDIKLLMAFNVFCGISLDNARLYQISLDLTRQVRGFVEASSAMNTTKTIRDILT